MKVRLLVAVPAFLALVAFPAMAQSADPMKRDEWAKVMDQCMRSIDNRADRHRINLPSVCKGFAERAMEDTFENRYRKFIRKQAAEVMSGRKLPSVLIPGNNVNAMIDETAVSNHREMETQIRFGIIEQCQADPMAIAPEECERIGDISRIFALEGLDNIQAIAEDLN